MAVGVAALVLLHLVGFAGLLGGSLAQIGGRPPEVNRAMLYGGWLALLTGLGLVALEFVRGQPVNYLVYGIKLALTAFVVLLVAKNRKFEAIPGGLLLLIAGLALVNAGLSVAWSAPS